MQPSCLFVRPRSPLRTLGLLLLALLVLAALVDFVAAGRDFYSILGVKRDANDRLLKKAYHKLSRKWHPDKNKAPEAEKKFVEISHAYEVLSDEKTRKIYGACKVRCTLSSFGQTRLCVGKRSLCVADDVAFCAFCPFPQTNSAKKD
jgi:hypothetical protein